MAVTAEPTPRAPHCAFATWFSNRIVAAVGVLCTTTCGTADGNPSRGTVRINEASIQGCRKPGDPGCETCCRVNDGADSCRWWTGSDSPDVKPWFNAWGLCSGAPVPCTAACARCTERDEEELRAFAEPVTKCDCDSLPPNPDPCFSSGCGCTCAIYDSRAAVCSAE
jgi:hypothetical protein